MMHVASYPLPRPSVIRALLLRSAMVGGIGLIIAVSMGIEQNGWWMIPLFIGSATAGFIVWNGYRWPDNWSPYLSFGGVVLIALIANRFLYLADFFLSGERFSEWPFPSHAREWAVLKAEIITLIGTLTTVAVWMLANGPQYSPRLLLNTRHSFLIRALTASYTISLLGLMLVQSNPAARSAFGQLIPTLLGLGIACSFFLPMVIKKSTFFTLTLVVILSLPSIYLALLSGMKESIILSLIPVMYCTWLVVRNRVARTTLIAVAILIVALITSFVGYYRDQVWIGKRSLTQQQALSEFSIILATEGVVDTMVSGLQKFLSRSNASTYRGWAISLADEQGYEPELVFASMLYVFVPRILWPEKPLIQQGWEYSGLVFGRNFMDASGSSTAAGLYPALYLGYGWPAVLAGAIGIGLMIAGLFKLAWRVGGPLMVGLYGFCLLPFALRLDETWTVGAMSGPIIGFVYLTVILLTVRFVSLLLKVS